MDGIVYILCAATSILCALLLLRGYRDTKMRLLLWSGLCFVLLGASNVVLCLDLLVVREADLSLLRTGLSFAGAMVMLFGLIWETV